MLSGCETGRGTVGADEQFVGLLTSLLQAGACSVLSTLWPVDDEDALGFASRFYGRLDPNNPLGTLAATQRERMHESRTPLGWAGHTLVGLP